MVPLCFSFNVKYPFINPVPEDINGRIACPHFCLPPASVTPNSLHVHGFLVPFWPCLPDKGKYQGAKQVILSPFSTSPNISIEHPMEVKNLMVPPLGAVAAAVVHAQLPVGSQAGWQVVP